MSFVIVIVVAAGVITPGFASDAASELPVERFMRDYYRHARAIQNFSELVIEQCSARASGSSSPREVTAEGDGFRIAGDQLEIPHAALLREVSSTQILCSRLSLSCVKSVRRSYPNALSAPTSARVASSSRRTPVRAISSSTDANRGLAPPLPKRTHGRGVGQDLGR